MPTKCCVPCCQTNYDGSHERATVFRFPKLLELSKKWLKAINRMDFVPGPSARVCIKHFAEEFILREHRATRDDGTVLAIPRKNLALTKDAYPTLFPNQPNYLSSEPPTKRRKPEDREADLLTRDELIFQKWNESDSIHSLQDLKTDIIKVKLDGWYFVSSEDFVTFFICDINIIPHVKVSIKIFQDLRVKIWKTNIPVDMKSLNWLLGENCQCDKLSKLTSLLSHLKHLSNTTSEENISKAKELLQDCIGNISENDSNHGKITRKLQFLIEQLSHLTMLQPRYTPDLILWSSSIFFTFPAAYRLMRDSGVLKVPHPNYLKTLTLQLGTLSSGISNSHSKYLQEKLKHLEPHEKIVNLLLDEIYVKPGLAYKGGKIEGRSYDSAEDATTIQAFMVSSVFSKNRDVVALYPVKHLTAPVLHELTLKVLQLVSHCGFSVLSLPI